MNTELASKSNFNIYIYIYIYRLYIVFLVNTHHRVKFIVKKKDYTKLSFHAESFNIFNTVLLRFSVASPHHIFSKNV